MKSKYRVGAVILAVALALVIAVCAIAASTDTNEAPEVKGFNLSVKETVYLDVAVDFKGLEKTAQSFGLLVFEEADGVTVPETLNRAEFDTFKTTYPKYAADLKSTETAEVDGTACHIFQYTGLAAKQMTDYVYAVAYVQDAEGKYKYSSPVKYSIYQYADAMITKDAESAKLLKAMLKYGAKAQLYFGYRIENLPTMGYAVVNLKDAKFEDGTIQGLYKTDTAIKIDSLTHTVTGVTDWYIVADDGRKILVENTKGEINVINSNFTLQPVIRYEATASVPEASGTYTYTVKLNKKALEDSGAVSSAFRLGGSQICEINEDGKVFFNGAEIGTIGDEEQIFSFVVNYTSDTTYTVTAYRDGYEVGAPANLYFMGTTASLEGAINEDNTYVVAGAAPERASTGGIIIYNTSGGTLPEGAVTSYNKGEFTQLPFELGAGTNTGKEFAGWYTEDGTFINHIPETAKCEALNLTAKWVDEKTLLIGEDSHSSNLYASLEDNYGNNYYYAYNPTTGGSTNYLIGKSLGVTEENKANIKFTLTVDLADIRSLQLPELNGIQQNGFSGHIFRIRSNQGSKEPSNVISLFTIAKVDDKAQIRLSGNENKVLATLDETFTKIIVTFEVGEDGKGILKAYNTLGVELAKTESITVPSTVAATISNLNDWFVGAGLNWYIPAGSGIAYDNLQVYTGEYIPELEAIPAGKTKITYETNNGVFTAQPEKFVNSGFVLPTDIKNGDATFLGWYANDDGVGTPITKLESDAPSKLNVYAKWYYPIFDENFENDPSCDAYFVTNLGSTGVTYNGIKFYSSAEYQGKGSAYTKTDEFGNTWVEYYTSDETVSGKLYNITVSQGSLGLANKEALGGGKITFTVDLAKLSGDYSGRSGYSVMRLRVGSTMLSILGTSGGKIYVGGTSTQIGTLTDKLQKVAITLDVESNVLTAYNATTGEIITKKSMEVNFADVVNSNSCYLEWRYNAAGGLAFDNLDIYAGAYNHKAPTNKTALTYKNVTENATWKTLVNAGETYTLPTEVEVKYGTFAGWYTTPDFRNGTKITEIPASGAPETIILYAKANMDVILDETFQDATVGAKSDDTSYLNTKKMTFETKKKTGATAEVKKDDQGNIYVEIISGPNASGSDPAISGGGDSIDGEKMKLAGGKVTFMIDLATATDGTTEDCNFRIRGKSSSDTISVFKTAYNTDTKVGTVKLGTTTTVLATLGTDFTRIIVTLDAYANTLTAYNVDGTVIAAASFSLNESAGTANTIEWFENNSTNITNWQLSGGGQGLKLDNVKIYFGAYVPEAQS